MPGRELRRALRCARDIRGQPDDQVLRQLALPCSPWAMSPSPGRRVYASWLALSAAAASRMDFHRTKRGPRAASGEPTTVPTACGAPAASFSTFRDLGDNIGEPDAQVLNGSRSRSSTRAGLRQVVTEAEPALGAFETAALR